MAAGHESTIFMKKINQRLPRVQAAHVIDESMILRTLNAAITLIFNVLKGIDPTTLEKTTGLIFATKLDASAYKTKKQKEKLIHDARKAASYILLDQLIFYERLSSDIPEKYERLTPLRSSTLAPLKEKFGSVLKDDIKSIFQVNILPYLPDSEATVSAINSVIGILAGIDLSNNDLLGKIFHNLIPLEIRKHIAAFYTSNIGGRMLASLGIQDADDVLVDLACGSGTLLVEGYKIIKEYGVGTPSGDGGTTHKKILTQVFGNDIGIFATHLATMNLALQGSLSCTGSVNISIGDGFRVYPGEDQTQQMFFSTGIGSPKQHDPNGEKERTFAIQDVSVVIMNPPFTRHERVEAEYTDTIKNILTQEGYSEYLSGKMSLQHYFLMHADKFLKKGGRLAFVIPTNTFNVELTQQLINFLVAKEYHLKYLVSVNSQKGTFSEGCNFKEYLFIAEKGQLTKESTTKLVLLNALPQYIDVDIVVERIKHASDDEKTCLKDLLNKGSEREDVPDIDISIKIISTNKLYSSPRWDVEFWNLNDDDIVSILKNDKLVPLKDSKEFVANTGFHSTYSDNLIIPNKWFDVIEDLGGHGIRVRRDDGLELVIPSKYVRKSLREPRFYQKIYTRPSHWVIDVSRTMALDVEFSESFLEYSTAKLSRIIEEKAKKGGKIKEKLEDFWYCHPHETGCETKTSNLWTFNRYGLWRRKNAAFYTAQKITANDGFHVYAYSGGLKDARALQLLNSWYNSSIHLYDFLRKCRVPAIHVQQVLKNDREDMFVPILNKLDGENASRILRASKNLWRNGKGLIVHQLGQKPRRELDYQWLVALGMEEGKIDDWLGRLYSTLKHVLRHR